MPPYFLPLIIPGGVLTLLGAFFLTIGLIRKLPTRHWEATVGQVVKKGKLFPGLPDSSPTFRYMAHDGQTYERTSLITQRPGIPPGRNVPVLYHPENPKRAVINTFAQNGSAFILIGSIIMGVGLILFIILLALLFSNGS
ncbi:DUF3592 domain-containing protein [Paenibacillus senegalensis]|uniref:DUF3592 domain-containing protein n=1 Tax=Paenibacillus senegalensis TaxID=1465766 RepID=UPI000287FF4A|nr:DUF3592 domain-containing protein [Paenibacillus senegalensis]